MTASRTIADPQGPVETPGTVEAGKLPARAGRTARGLAGRTGPWSRRAVIAVAGVALATALAAAPAAAAPSPAAASGHGLGLLPTTGLQKGVSPAASGLLQDAAALPAAVDISAWDPPVGDQGVLNDCASWATGYYYRYWLRNRISGETATFAPMFLYSQITGGTDSGSSIGDNVNLLELEGIPHESDYPQGYLDYDTQPTPAEVQAAASYRIASGSFLMFDTGVGNEAQVAIEASLAAGRPVVLSFPMFANFIEAGATSYFVDVPSPSMASYGYHGVFAPKYDSKGVWIENSWGTAWGRSGWAELSWAFVNEYAAEGWTMTAQNDGVLAVSAFGNSAVAGTAQSLTVTAKSAAGATAAGYLGTVHFTSTDPSAVLPADYTFTAADAGTHTFSVTFRTAGVQSVTVTDRADRSISGTQTGTVAAAGSTYHAVSPARVLDTRRGGGGVTNIGLTGKFTAGSVRAFAVAGALYVGGGGNVAVPEGATAVTGNLTIVNATGSGVVALGPTESASGNVTTISFAARDIRAVGVTVGLGPNGTLAAVFRSASTQASVDLVFDVTGYFTPDTTGATYHPVNPGRVLDTRPTGAGHTNIGLVGPFLNRVVRNLAVVGATALAGQGALVPAGATAVTGNLTVTNATSPGYVALGPTVTPGPSTSTLNVATGTNRANGVTVALAPGGTLGAVWCGTARSSADVIFDVTGYFTADTTGLSYHPITPVQALDSSTNQGLAGAFATGKARTLALGGVGGIPQDAAGISGQLTIVGPTSSGWALISPAPVAAPTTSSLNTTSRVNCANGLNVPLSSGRVALVWVGAAGSQANLQLAVTGYWSGSGATGGVAIPGLFAVM